MSSSMTLASATASATTRVYIFPALASQLCSKITTEARGARRWGRRRTHDVRQSGLIAAVRRGLRRGVHGHIHMLLRHLLRELICICVRGDIGHLPLHLEVAGKVLLRLDHAHVDILLVRRSNLLLLLLQNFDLLGDGQLFHCAHSVSGSAECWRGDWHALISGVSSDGLRR